MCETFQPLAIYCSYTKYNNGRMSDRSQGFAPQGISQGARVSTETTGAVLGCRPTISKLWASLQKHEDNSRHLDISFYACCRRSTARRRATRIAKMLASAWLSCLGPTRIWCRGHRLLSLDCLAPCCIATLSCCGAGAAVMWHALCNLHIYMLFHTYMPPSNSSLLAQGVGTATVVASNATQVWLIHTMLARAKHSAM